MTSRGADEVGASSAALWTDATAFLRAADRNDAEPALSLYHGDFLTGLHIPESSADLDQWMSHTRNEFRRRAARLAWTMAAHAEREKNPVGAAHWGRRAQDIEADDEASLRRLMQLLDRSGDTGGAVRAYDEFATRLKADLSVEPSSETRTLVQEFRNRRSISTAKAALQPVPEAAPPPDHRAPNAPPPPQPRPSRRAPAVAGFAFAVLIMAAVAALARRDNASSVPLVGPVVVAAFKNETGDTSLSIWGRYAGDWITQGLQSVGRLPVVPWTSALHASRFADSSPQSDNADPVSILHRETGANTVITGSYYRVNDSVRFRVEVSDAPTGKLIFSLPGITVTPDSIEAAIRALRDQLMGGIRLASDRRYANDPRFGRQPPRFAAFAAYDRGFALFSESKYGEAAVEYERAFGLDSSFVTPALSAATAYLNQARYPRLDTLVRLLAERRESLNEFQGLQLASLEARLRGDGRGALEALRRGSVVAPNSNASYNLALQAISMNRPHEALRALEGVDPNAVSVNSWPPYWIYLAHANHLVSRHDAELKAVAELRRRYPDRSVGLVLQVSALAALNRTEAIDSVFAADGSSPNTYWSTGAALATTGEELVAHGHPERAGQYYSRAIAWFETQRRTDPGNRSYREWLVTALYQAGRWEDARPVADSLMAEFPNRHRYHTVSALLAARRGDTAGARRALGEGQVQDPGSHLAAQARIAAILGDADRAAALLTEALEHGIPEFQWDHADWLRDFERVISDPRIRRLLIGGLDQENRKPR